VSDESLFREVDEEVRQDEYKKLWDRYGTLLIAVCTVMIAAVAGWKAWEYYQRKQTEAASILFFDGAKAAAEGKSEDAERLMKQVTSPGYAQLGSMQVAGALAAGGKTKEAIAAYDAIAADAAVEPVLRDAAAIRAGYLLVDTAKPDELLGRLGRFDKDDQVWRFQAREIFGLTAYRSGDFAMAERYMQALATDAESPRDMKERAQMMLQLIAPQLAK
jgi:hypothetical protein